MYPTEYASDLRYEFVRCRSEALDTVSSLANRTYVTVLGREYGKHGLARRISTLRHCVGQVFAAVPPTVALPNRTELMDATVGLQSFFINVVGSLDNLARIWVHESGLFDGVEVPRTHVGLGPKNTRIRESLPREFLQIVEEFEAWFGYVENYRHALAHRIPLYIPPRQYRPSEWDEWSRLDVLRWTAIREHRWDDVEPLENLMHEIGTFAPIMMHSFEEPSTPVAIHPQILCDLASVLKLTNSLLPYLTMSKPRLQ